MKIGVFDSGLGGVIIATELANLFPSEDIVCVADSKNFPYGTKSDQELRLILEDMISSLEQLQVDIIVVACNTASALIDRYNLTSRVPLITIIDLTVDYALEIGKHDQFLILGTTSTINSNVYVHKLRHKSRQALGYDCQPLVSLVETGRSEYGNLHDTLKEYFNGFKQQDKYNIILGCTHFLLLREDIQALFPKSVVINPIRPLQRVLQNLLVSTEHDGDKGSLVIFSTADSQGLTERTRDLLGDSEIQVLLLQQTVEVE